MQALEEPQTSPRWFQEALANAPRRSVLNVEGADIEILTWGQADKPGLLFLHGARAHADWWSHLAPLFARDHNVVSMSWSGMGRSQWRERYTLPQYVREALAVCEHVGMFAFASKPTIVAHSFGGYMGALIAAQHGERFKRIVIVDSSIKPQHTAWPQMTSARVYPSLDVAKAHFRFAPPQPAPSYILDWIAEHALIERDFDGSVGWVWRFDPELRIKLELANVWDALAKPQCPIAFVRGELSGVVTDELAYLQALQAPPDTPYIIVRGAAHHLMADEPLALVDTLQDLIASQATEQAS